MYKFLAGLLFLFFLIGCNLLEPTCLVIQNESNYPITVTFKRGMKEKIEIKKNDGDFTMAYPGELNFNITIETIGFNKSYTIALKYIEKKEFKFQL